MQPKNERALVVIALMVVGPAAAFVDERWLRAALVVLPALFIAQRTLLGAATDSVAGAAAETGGRPGGEDRREDMTVRRHIQQLLGLIRDFYATCHMVAVGQLSAAKAKRLRGSEKRLSEKRLRRTRAGAYIVAAVIVPLAACEAPRPGYGAVFDGTAGRWIDLTHAFGPSTIYWPTDTAGFQLTELAYGRTEGGWFYASYAFSSAEHGGTHLDAPIHFAEGRLTADDIPLSGLMGPAAVVDVTDRSHPDYLVTVEDIEAWEAEHGPLPDGGVLLLRTGWGARWDDRTAYLGTSREGSEAVPELHFPGLAPEAAEWLAAERGVVAVGIDTPSIDYGQSTDFRAHVALYAENISGFENVANLDLLPEAGAYVVALPMKIEGGSGGPLRIVAFVPSA